MPGSYTDFVLDDSYFHTGIFEGVAQNIALFNEASNGAIRLFDRRVPGHYHHTLGYKTIEDAWSRRDITANTAIASGDTKKFSEHDQIGVKFNAKMFMQPTLNQFQKNFDPEMKRDWAAISQRIGGAVSFARMKQQLNQALMCVRAALKNSSATDNQHSAAVSSANYNGKLNNGDLVDGLFKMGDMAGRIVCWVMHSQAFAGLLKNQILDKVTGIADYALYAAAPITLNKPTLVTDSTALVNVVAGSDGYTEYFTLGLVEGAVEVTNSEMETLVVQPKTGSENILLDMQGEGAHNLEVKGAKWDVGNGGLNPTETALATASNWDPSGVHYKNRSGVVITHR
jgi:hypothetical protein